MTKGITIQKCKDKNIIKNFNPLQHQRETLDYFLDSNKKGLLLYHKLGSGKTCTSILIADEMLKNGFVNKVYVLTPGSLRSNWVKEYCTKCGFDNKNLEENFVFITYNYDVHNELRHYNFNYSLVIIDETHNLINSVINKSKNSLSIYNKLLLSDCRIIALSGTPVKSNPKQWYALHKLLDPSGDPNVPKDIVSYFPGNEKYFPKVNEIVINVKLTISQELNLIQILDWEQKILKMYNDEVLNKLKTTNPELYLKKKEQYTLAKLGISSKKLSNVYYPPYLANVPDTFVENGGWISDEIISTGILKEMSYKFISIIYNINAIPNQKHMVYSFYKTKGGVNLLSTLLQKCNISSAVLSGDLNDTQKENILSRFNAPDNSNGEHIKVILVTGAGKEGMTLLDVNNLHMVEQSRTITEENQIIGRCVRYQSHKNLPSYRNFVNIFRYRARRFNPKALIFQNASSLEEEIYIKAKANFESIEKINDMLIKNSI